MDRNGAAQGFRPRGRFLAALLLAATSVGGSARAEDPPKDGASEAVRKRLVAAYRAITRPWGRLSTTR